MPGQTEKIVHHVTGPEGAPLTRGDLPSSLTLRWTVRRKAAVVCAVRGGLMSLGEACTLYSLSLEEYLSWQVAVDRYGLAGLKVRRI